MSKKRRVMDLEAILNMGGDISFEFVKPLIVEGVAYQAIEDVPQEMRDKYKGKIIVGYLIDSRKGRTAMPA
jgi:hypothetical protein